VKEKDCEIVYTPDAATAQEEVKKDWLRRKRSSCLDSAKAELGIRLHLTRSQKDKLMECGKRYAAHFCWRCNNVSYLQMHCKLRYCPDCWNRLQRQRIAILCQMTGPLKWITLTRGGKTGETLAQGITDLQQAFQKLRRRKAVSSLFQSGYYQIECKPRSDGTWHVHMHILAVGDYFPHKQLVRIWGECLGQKTLPSVRINSVSAQMLARYITKYNTKPADYYKMTNEQLSDFVDLKKRLWAHWGNVSELFAKSKKGGCPACRGEIESFWSIRRRDAMLIKFCFHGYELIINADSSA